MSEDHKERIRAIVSGPGRTSRWITQHLDYAEPDWCLIYPFRWEQDHYPKYRSQPKTPNYPVHRLMCEYRHGPPPTPGHHSAHSCSRGTEGCVNPMHVSWKTPSENQKDRFDGIVRRRDKITPEIAQQIRALSEHTKPCDIALQFKVSLRNVRMILAGETWKEGRKTLSEADILAIRAQQGRMIAADVAKQYPGLSMSVVYRIWKRRSYSWLPDAPHG